MSKLKIVKFGDERGIGAIVEATSFFGILTRTWTLVPRSNNDGTIMEYWGFDKWTCRETGRWHYRLLCRICTFYTAQFNTRAGS